MNVEKCTLVIKGDLITVFDQSQGVFLNSKKIVFYLTIEQ